MSLLSLPTFIIRMDTAYLSRLFYLYKTILALYLVCGLFCVKIGLGIAVVVLISGQAARYSEPHRV